VQAVNVAVHSKSGDRNRQNENKRVVVVEGLHDKEEKGEEKKGEQEEEDLATSAFDRHMRSLQAAVLKHRQQPMISSIAKTDTTMPAALAAVPEQHRPVIPRGKRRLPSKARGRR
jgi:hypothetical protein